MRLVVPYFAGGNADIMARVMALKLTERLGQQFVVDNRGGGGSIIGTELAAKSPHDGYTLLFVANAFATNPVFVARMPYDTIKDFAPISITGSTPLMLTANNALPAKTVKELIALAKARPGQINYASSGHGSPANLAGALFNHMAGVDIVHVPYKGTSQATTEVIGGQVQIGYPSMTSVLPHVKSGKLRALAMTAAQRSALAPDVPTVAESGVPGYEASIWNGMLAPAGTSKEIVGLLNREVVALIKTPDVQERFAALGADPRTSTPEEFASYIRSDMQRWSQVAKAAGIKIDLGR